MSRLGTSSSRRSVHQSTAPEMAATPPSAGAAVSWDAGDDDGDDIDDVSAASRATGAVGGGRGGGDGGSGDAAYDAAAVAAAFQEMVASGEFDDLDEDDKADISAATAPAATAGRDSGGRPGRPGAPPPRPVTPNATVERRLRRAGVLANLPAGLRIANADAKCPGCGCYVQAADAGAPGFVPSNVLVEYKDAADAAVMGVTEGGDPLPPPPPPLCQRCFRLRHYGDIDVSLRVGARTAVGAVAAGAAAAGAAAGEAGAPAAVTAAASGHDGDGDAAAVDDGSAATLAAESAARNAANRRVLTPEVFRKNLARLASRPAVIIYLVDVIDFQGTFLSDLRSLVGPTAPVMMALNKADLLPAGYSAERVARWARTEARSLGVDALTSVHLTSARTGAGVKELLADAILLGRQTNADVYVVGAANVGKSTLINQLLAGADRMRGGKALAAAERLRIKSEQAEVARAAAAAMTAETGGAQGDPAVTKDPQAAAPEATSGAPDAALEEDPSLTTTPAEARAARKRESAARAAKLLTTSVIPGTTLGMVRVPLGGRLSLYDTPGVILPRSLTHRLTAAELRAVLPTRRLAPVTLRLGAGKALYLGGLARIEVVAGRPFFFSAFVSGDVKVHPGKADDGAAFTARHTGGLLTPPFEADRAAALGGWSEQVVEVSGAGWKTASVDVVLSGLGWVALTGAGDMTLRVATPGGVGVFVRDALMPYETEGGVSVYTGGGGVNRLAERKSKQGRARRRRKAASDW